MMYRETILFFSILSLFSVVSAQILQTGQCDADITLQANFNAAQFTGEWYENARTVNPGQQGDCSTLDIAGTGNTYTFTYNSLNRNIPEVLTAPATLLPGTARFALNINNAITNFWVLGTNYVSFTLGYRCENVGANERNVFVWLLGRNTSYDPIFTNPINNALAPLNITVDDLVEVDRSDEACYELPVIPSGQAVIIPGQCDPNISPLANFDAGRFVGTWYEIYSYFSENAQGTCSRAEYSLGNGVVNVLNSQVVNQTLETISGVASVVAGNNGRLNVTLEILPGVFADQDLWVIATDYDNYAITYSCTDLTPTTKRVFSWIVSRNRQLSNPSQVAVNQVVDSIIDLNFAYYEQSDQTDVGCFYFPEPSPDTIVQFPGSCDLNIPAVPNFDPTRYTGLWHDIESYPSGFVEGTCNNAFYTLVDGVVDVFNTQVINQTLDTINGVAVPVSSDGSAQLEVTFPIAGTNATITTSYWVLATDYDNYALVYTCQYNSATDTRNERSQGNGAILSSQSQSLLSLNAVWSWKLSRSKTLSVPANTAINNVIATIPVLDQRYYITRDQSPAGCFYVPEPQPGMPVIFPGQCDNTIPVVPNFDLNAFQGTWYEIETYPKEQSGDCVQHEYTQGVGNNLNLESSFNVNQLAQISSSVLTFTSTDGSARFSITINVGNNNTIEIPFWILAVDYTDYAFAYSCVNRNSDFRAIYSWKLSRNQQQLSAQANAAINSVISSVDVLGEQFFEAVDQSEVACTQLPEIPFGQPIILDGQCNPNIDVVQNFQPGRYVGLWYLIESYPSEFQNGDCNDATYTAQANGSVLVFNTQVINQTLDTITGLAELASNDGSARLSVVFPEAPFPVEYWVIATDYDSYSLVYSCVNVSNDTQQIWSWKLSRSKSLSTTAIEAIDESINSVAVLNSRYYYEIDNSDDACFYYPEADGTPLVFRGQCDETIPTVVNFDAVAYMGSWYDIESYPQQFQEGTCSTADYTLRDGGVDVFNTQVVSQRLDTIDGRAVLLESNNNEAKLSVTFPIAGTNATIASPYWVLSTNYNDYALVYACQNLNANSRSVSSWKLSRQRTLSAAAQNAINQIVAGINVLSQQYYENKGHTDADCFYYPEPTGEPVTYRGQCDLNIQAVPNFDLNAFAGTWNEIESYPKEQVGGQCINHQFTANATNNGLLLTSNQVFNSESLVSNDGEIVLDSNDGSGRFVLSIDVNNQTITFPYWVLATDYNNYALVYSCINVDNESRRVYSWKLSRTRQLSAPSNTAINTAMAAVQVLDQQYFEPVSQTDDDCFYLPETGPNEPAIFTGQCELNIPVVQNFDASRYANRWFDIESYFDDYEGTCIDSTFTQSGNGYNVLFTQVVNQTLDSTNSVATLAADGSGRLTVDGIIDYWILGTDYDSWSLVYSCQNINADQRRVRVWKMSRTRQLTAAANTAINTIASNINVINDRFFSVRDHSVASCFYYPEPTGLPVRFRGRCDETIPVAQNFNVADYLGQWYDIQSYPQAFQDGQCATALYTLGDGVVDVFNTQVVNQQLDTITGTAVVASTDNSARLDVTFEVAGMLVTTPYWVLSTDYTSYSLVYSCYDINEEYISVAAWKLSRTRNLTATAETVINNVMSNIPVLQQQYFEETSHSAEDCFFYPDNEGGPVILDGQCPDPSEVDAVNNFSVPEFAGVWHEISRFPSELQNGECASTEYIVNNQNTFSITQNIVANESLTTATGPGVVSSDGRGIFTTVIGNEQISTLLSVYILDTDYTDFALAYSCRNLNNGRRQVYSWKLGRSRSGVNQASNDRIDAIVSSNIDLFEPYYEDTDQSNQACFYYPEFEQLPESIELPGPCNDNIVGVPNFNAAAYLGRWFEIEKYPQPFQFGECGRAEYSLGANAVDVYNTQVLDQTLLVQNGTAVVSSTDGTGELTVTFVVNGMTNVANYIILATDYTSYSLVYSCRNLQNGNRQVSSWKLSRQPTLSNAVNQNLDTIIANTEGLRQQYYTPTSQAIEDCFYVPEPNPEDFVTFRGQCGNIAGVQNFDIQRYLGIWHEIERYPTDDDDGVCTSADFRSSGTNQFQVVDTSVFDLSANIITNDLIATADGRLIRTINIDGAQGASDVWVLATDYETYSLLYSCYDVDSENMRVWSAKHSRTRHLPLSAQLAINQVVEANQYLYQQFYETVDQSDTACFYYPEVTGAPVTLPGQCDDNIPVVQDVSIEEYTGTWYQIERYPQFFETGNCTGARYTLDEDTGTVRVLNWEVIDGEVDSIEGTATVSSNDGSARFIVELPSREVEGEVVTTPLYVLTSDYTTYSLAYSCFNINPYYRRIGVWKLSRTRTMPASGTTAINAYMAQRQELDQRYFISVGQNEDCPEPSSSYLVRSSIIMLLVCSILQLFV